jgi:hypothetical protein
MGIERYFDLIYNALSIAFLLALAVAVLRGLLLARRGGLQSNKHHGWGSALTAFGTALALAGGLVADGFLQDSALFQQVRFGTYFVGFAIMVAGVAGILRAGLPAEDARQRVFRRALVVLFLVSLAVSIPFLAIPSSFVRNRYHEQVQLPVYWLPLLVSTAAAATLLVLTGRAVRGRARVRAFLVAGFELLLFLGLLRESELLPDLGDPLLNLLVSFVPFAVGGILIAIGAGMRSSSLVPDGRLVAVS